MKYFITLLILTCGLFAQTNFKIDDYNDYREVTLVGDTVTFKSCIYDVKYSLSNNSIVDYEIIKEPRVYENTSYYSRQFSDEEVNIFRGYLQANYPAPIDEALHYGNTVLLIIRGHIETRTQAIIDISTKSFYVYSKDNNAIEFDKKRFFVAQKGSFSIIDRETGVAEEYSLLPRVNSNSHLADLGKYTLILNNKCDIQKVNKNTNWVDLIKVETLFKDSGTGFDTSDDKYFSNVLFSNIVEQKGKYYFLINLLKPNTNCDLVYPHSFLVSYEPFYDQFTVTELGFSGATYLAKAESGIFILCSFVEGHEGENGINHGGLYYLKFQDKFVHIIKYAGETQRIIGVEESSDNYKFIVDDDLELFGKRREKVPQGRIWECNKTTGKCVIVDSTYNISDNPTYKLHVRKKLQEYFPSDSVLVKYLLGIKPKITNIGTKELNIHYVTERERNGDW